MLNLKGVSIRRGPKSLIDHADLCVHAGWRVGILGRNGSGKSSLFAALQNPSLTDTGDIYLPKGWQIAHLAQEVAALDCSALDYVLGGDHEYLRLNDAIEQSHQLNEQQLAELHAAFDDIDGYSVPARAGRILSGLGFDEHAHTQAVRQFSGGWRMRLNLARTLMSRADLLLLDEPTNHLDLDAILWLEQWLSTQFRGTLLLIAHDVAFLNRCVDHIAHIHQQKITLYSGNYDAFETQYAEHARQQQAAYERQQREAAHIQSFIDRFRAKASKAKQAQSRLKALQRLQSVAPAYADSPFHFQFTKPNDRIPERLLGLHDATMGYTTEANGKDAHVVIQPCDMTIRADSRIALLGPNGAGKSTLLQSLCSKLPLLCGEHWQSEHARVGYFAQHQLDSLGTEASAMTLLLRLAPNESEANLRRFFGSFGFNGDDVFKACGQFSGGERARLALALIVWQQPNILILDEPTNHLDLEMRHALSLALQTFEGALVVVSHDRQLINDVCNEYYLLAKGTLSSIEGGVEAYKQWIDKQKTADTKSNDSHNPKVTTTDPVNVKDKRRLAAEKRKQLQPLRKQVERLEKTLQSLQADKQRLEDILADTALYEAAQKTQLMQHLDEQAELMKKLEATEEAWLEAQEALEQAQAELD